MTTCRVWPLHSVVDIDEISAQVPKDRKMSAVYTYSNTEVTPQSKSNLKTTLIQDYKSRLVLVS